MPIEPCKGQPKTSYPFTLLYKQPSEAIFQPQLNTSALSSFTRLHLEINNLRQKKNMPKMIFPVKPLK
jgi:hypothetical protein